MDPFYELYKNAGIVPIEIGTNGVITLTSLVGFFLNLCLVYVTIYTKSLHRPCNILIAIFAFFISFYLVGYSIKFFVFLFGINYVSLKTCYFVQFVPLMCSSFGINLQLCIGIDRLFAILYPIWYKIKGKFIIFKLLISINLIVTTITTLIYYHGASMHWERPVMCTLRDPATQVETALFSFYKSFTIYFGEFLCYLLIWAIILCRKSSHISSKHKRLMISLSIITSMGLFWVLISILYSIIVPRLNVGMFTHEYVVEPILFTLGVLANGSTTPILLLCSREYSSAFRECFRRTNAVSATANIQIIRQI